MTKEEFTLSIRQQVVDTARAMLERKTSFLAGARKLVALRHDAGAADNDPDFMVFVVIESDTDALPIGTVRDRWNQHALARLEPEIQAAETWARDDGAAACASLIARFAQSAG
jgi:hypothetical protein